MKKKSTKKGLKFYKTIIVTGMEWDVFIDINRHGAEFSSDYHDTGRGRIILGTKAGELAAFASLIHELLEAELACAGLRYNDPDYPARYLFVFNHTNLTEACKAVAQSLRDVGLDISKLGGGK